MAEFIHGTKPELGPTHDATGALMCKQDCEACANRIFTLHTSFFVKEFKQKAAQQHGEASVCHDAKCAACNQEPSDVKCCGKDCSRDTGKIRTGVLACEIYQVHSRNAKCASVPGPVKRCGCLIHAKCWLLCSQECLLSSKYAKSVPEEDRPTFAALFAEKKFSIPEMGPLLSHDQYDGPDLSAAELALVCCTCGKRDAGKVCSGCKVARYCTVECQKAAWKEHKAKCTPLSEKQQEELKGGAAKNHESLASTD